MQITMVVCVCVCACACAMVICMQSASLQEGGRTSRRWSVDKMLAKEQYDMLGNLITTTTTTTPGLPTTTTTTLPPTTAMVSITAISCITTTLSSSFFVKAPMPCVEALYIVRLHAKVYNINNLFAHVFIEHHCQNFILSFECAIIVYIRGNVSHHLTETNEKRHLFKENVSELRKLKWISWRFFFKFWFWNAKQN